MKKVKNKVILSIDEYNRLIQDHKDMMDARQTVFERCACGRMKERGIICPTNQEGKICKKGE